ncbi:hypothetical protein [Candidatus Arsenophonus triatominarum]
MLLSHFWNFICLCETREGERIGLLELLQVEFSSDSVFFHLTP